MRTSSEVASNLTDAVADLNKRVAQATNGVVDLRWLIPVGLGALAVRQLRRNGLKIETAPWYVLAYYAFDSFIKLHYTRTQRQQKQKQNKRSLVELARLSFRCFFGQIRPTLLKSINDLLQFFNFGLMSDLNNCI